MTNDQKILDATKKGELVQFNLTDIKDQVADQMRAFLLNMMPKEAFDQVIEASWKTLTEPRPEVKDRYNNVKTPARPSELEEMVTIEMRKELKKRVALWSLEWGKTEDCAIGAKAMLSELVNAAAGQFIQRVGTQIVNEAASTLASGAQLSYISCMSCGASTIQGGTCRCGTYN